MTAIITEVTRAMIASTTADTRTASLGVTAIFLLVALLIQKELTRAVGGPLAKTWQQTLNTAIAPLLVAFGVVMVVRFADLLR